MHDAGIVHRRKREHGLLELWIRSCAADPCLRVAGRSVLAVWLGVCASIQLHWRLLAAGRPVQQRRHQLRNLPHQRRLHREPARLQRRAYAHAYAHPGLADVHVYAISVAGICHLDFVFVRYSIWDPQRDGHQHCVA